MDSEPQVSSGSESITPDATYSHLYEILARRARRYPEKIALGSQEGLIWQTVTSVQLLLRVNALAERLRALGVSEGDRVILWVPSRWWAPVYHFALWKLGAIVVPFDREMNADSAERIVQLVEPRAIIVGYGDRPGWAAGANVTEWWEPSAELDPKPEASSLPSEELAVIAFTSGTTGTPKGCMISHANLCSQVDAVRDNIPLNAECRLASILPLSHLFELTGGLLYPLASGAAIHYIPSRRAPDILRVLQEQRITHMIGVPQLFSIMGRALEDQLASKLPTWIVNSLAACAERLPLTARRTLYWPVHHQLGGHLRLLAAGGAALPRETQTLWERIGVRIVQGYGTSECSPVVACGLPDGSTPLGSVGRPVRGVEVRRSVDGQLLVRGPNVMRGYWKDPQHTAEVLTDGWYHTGDLATIDGAGNITLSGRAKELIVLPSGMNVWPQDVEDALRLEPGVKDACVIAVPTASGGATLHAYLLRAAGAGDMDASVLVARANGKLAQHQRVATASWWTEADFPRTPTLKVRRHLLPQPSPDQHVEVDSLAASDDPVAQAVRGVARVAAIAEGQQLAELGMDSLGLVDLALALEEKTGRPVADGDLRVDMTLADIRAMLRADDARGTGPVRSVFSSEPPLWPYGWGRVFRALGFPFELIYRFGVTRTIVLGAEHLHDLGPRVIVAGTHHSFADIHLVKHGLAGTAAAPIGRKLVIAASAANLADIGPAAWIGVLTFGTYPLNQTGERDASLRGLARLMQRGNAVLIFPQGTHSDPSLERAEDPSVRFRAGVGHLAGSLEAEVVPFGIAGTEKLMPAHLEHFRGLVIAGIPVSIRRGPLAIAFGEPARMSGGESPGAFAARLQDICYALTREAEAAIDSGVGRPRLAAP
ncbi:MAG TPA: AMP-binding protein [Chloroflexota bacterium]|nr:AMP-binding protein [Chloroflexota bacterium]